MSEISEAPWTYPAFVAEATSAEEAAPGFLRRRVKKSLTKFNLALQMLLKKYGQPAPEYQQPLSL